MNQELIHAVEKVLSDSGIQLSASEVMDRLQQSGFDLSLCTDPRSSIPAEIQAVLETLASSPESRIERLVLGGMAKFQWIFQSKS